MESAVTPAYRYRARVVRVIDGDTIVATLDLGLRVSTTVHLRVRGVDTPEMSTPEGRVVKARVVALFALRPNILVQTYKDQQSFSRWVADVWLDDGTLFTSFLASKE
jgi:micrococcal nuclease